MRENLLPFQENFWGSPGVPIAIGDTENDMSSGVRASPIKVSFIESDCKIHVAGRSVKTKAWSSYRLAVGCIVWLDRSILAFDEFGCELATVEDERKAKE